MSSKDPQNQPSGQPLPPVQPVDGPPIEPPPPPAQPAAAYLPPPPPAPGRLFRLRSVLAVAAAGVIVGGLGGGTVAHLAGGSEHGDHRPSGDHGLGVPPPPGGVPGAPRDDSDDDQYSGSGRPSAS